MRTSFLAFVAITTTTAISSSIYLASLESPTDIQKQLSTTTNTIAVAGTTTILGLLDSDDSDDQNSSL